MLLSLKRKALTFEVKLDESVIEFSRGRVARVTQLLLSGGAASPVDFSVALLAVFVAIMVCWSDAAVRTRVPGNGAGRR